MSDMNMFDINMCTEAAIDTLFDVWVGVIIDIGVEVSTDVNANVLVVAMTVW